MLVTLFISFVCKASRFIFWRRLNPNLFSQNPIWVYFVVDDVVFVAHSGIHSSWFLPKYYTIWKPKRRFCLYGVANDLGKEKRNIVFCRRKGRLLVIPIPESEPNSSTCRPGVGILGLKLSRIWAFPRPGVGNLCVCFSGKEIVGYGLICTRTNDLRSGSQANSVGESES